MPTLTCAPPRRAKNPRFRALTEVEPAGPMPWPSRMIGVLEDGRVVLAVAEGGSLTRLLEPIEMDSVKSEARAVLGSAGAGVPTLLVRLALALLARDAQLAAVTGGVP